MNKTALSLALTILLAGTPMCPAQDEIFHYNLNEGNGVEAHSSGSSAATLEIGSGMGWALKGAGVDGGTAITRVGDGEAHLKTTAKLKPLGELSSYTVTGWVKPFSEEPFAATLFRVIDPAGSGFQLQLVTRKGKENEPAWVCSLVSRAGTPGSAPGLWGPWGNPFSSGNFSPDEWIFFAAVIDPASRANRFVEFFMGTKDRPVVSLGGLRLGEDTDPETYRLRNIAEVGMGNFTGERRGFPIGLSLDDLRFFGSPEKNGGALNREALENIRLEAVKKSGASKQSSPREGTQTGGR